MTPAAILRDPDYPRLKAHMIGATGLEYYADKDADLATRLARRLAACGLSDCRAYLELLFSEGNTGAELDTIIADLTIGETFFFRHREVFDALRVTALPDIIARNRTSRRMRVWSAGCSVGAELYSLSILLERDFAGVLNGWNVELIGTDINREFLARARVGRFEEWALRGIPAELRQTCFTRADREWVIRPEYQEGVSFQYHNLVTHAFPSQLHGLFEFDLILCRNVTIYFSPDIVRRVTENFRQCLTDGGWLGVGHAEPNVELFRKFRTVNAPGAVLYQKPLSDAGEDSEKTLPGGAASDAWAGFQVVSSVREAPAPAFVPLPAPVTVATQTPATDPGAIKALADRGEWTEAARQCDELLARDSLNATVHFYRGLILEHLGRHADAEEALRRVVYLDRGHVLAHYYLALLLQRRGQLTHAVRSFRNTLQLLDPVDPANVFADGDGITAGELQALTRMHLSALEAV